MREIEIGWTFLARSHWGGAYNGEMKQLMVQHAFRFVDSVIFFVGPQNFRSQRAVEKMGGVRVASRPDTRAGTSFVYQITASTLGRSLRDNPAMVRGEKTWASEHSIECSVSTEFAWSRRSSMEISGK